MQIKINTPTYFEGHTEWKPWGRGSLYVEQESHIAVVWELLCQQDVKWRRHQHLIKVVPKSISAVEDLDRQAASCFGAEIRDVKGTKQILKASGIEILIYSTVEIPSNHDTDYSPSTSWLCGA